MVHRNEEFQTVEKSRRRNVKVKSEFDDSDGNLFKRLKFDFSQEEKNELGYNPLEEPSPLGLKLKKSPSFLDLIQMKLAQERSASLAKTLPRKEKQNTSVGAGVGVDNNNTNKLKASNFPATVLKIGTWEYKSKYEGDLVAKCYFAKHKLVWEVLDGGLKNKIEIQWADIMAIKATYPDNEPGTLDVVLSRQPLFFREINPQPRKHTLWQATTDFTSGQASLHRQHFLQFPEGILGKHFPKLIQCDPRLSFLSKQPQIVLDDPYFQQRVSIFDDLNGGHGSDMKTEGRFSLSGIRNTVSVSMSGISSSDFENQNPLGSHMKFSQNTRHSISEGYVNEEVSSKFNEAHGLDLLNQIKLPGLHPSMSVGDLVNHIGDCISEQMRFDDPSVSVNESQKRDILDEITQYLLNDNQTLADSDEKSIMSRVNSLCCLLQKDDPRAQNLQVSAQSARELAVGSKLEDLSPTNRSHENVSGQIVPSMGDEIDIGSNSQQGANMGARKDSVGELLLHLPRIASLPQFLFPED